MWKQTQIDNIGYEVGQEAKLELTIGDATSGVANTTMLAHEILASRTQHHFSLQFMSALSLACFLV